MAAVHMYVKTEEEAVVVAMQNPGCGCCSQRFSFCSVWADECLGPFRAAGDYECQRNDTAKNAEIIKLKDNLCRIL